MNPKGTITLNERSQTHTITHCMIPFIRQSQKDKTIVMETRSAVASGWEQAAGCDYKGAAGGRFLR